MAMKKYNPKGPYGGRGEYDIAKEIIAAEKKKKAGSYSPKPMSAAAKKKAAARGKETAAKTKPKSTVSKVVSRARIVAREAGDVKKAVKNVAKSGKSALNLDRTGNQYLGRQAVRETGKDLKKSEQGLRGGLRGGLWQRAGLLRHAVL